MKVLLVEDNPQTVNHVRQGLSEHGLSVDVAPSSEAALRYLQTSREYAIVLLDVMLPGGEGWAVLEALRGAGDQTPVIFLTARDTVDDRVRGLECGADDYMVKPFAFSELLARIHTVLRRGPGRAPEVIRIADLELDLARHRAMRGGRRLQLRPKEFALLSLMARRAGEALSRTFIAEQVWDVNFDGDSNVIDVHVRRLRIAIGDDEGDRKLIHTLKGVGYVFEDRSDRT
jgi:two-component system copper resistance phosphate regulon response regulator CusR